MLLKELGKLCFIKQTFHKDVNKNDIHWILKIKLVTENFAKKKTYKTGITCQNYNINRNLCVAMLYIKNIPLNTKERIKQYEKKRRMRNDLLELQN